MPRAPIAALIEFLAGSLLGGAGILALGWAVTAYFKVEWGFDAMMWVAEQSPFPLHLPPEQLANRAIQDNAMIAIGVAGLFLWMIGSSLLRAARANLRPTAGAAAIAPAQAGARSSHAAAAPHEATTASAGSTIFARTLLSDHPPTQPPGARHASAQPSAARPSVALKHAPDAQEPLRAGLEADLAGWARLIGKDGKFTPQQRAALGQLTPEQQAVLAKFSKWAPTRKQAVIGILALFAIFQILPALLSLLLNR